MDFDSDKKIIEKQDRPAIWNTKSAEYSDKNLTFKTENHDDFYANFPVEVTAIHHPVNCKRNRVLR